MADEAGPMSAAAAAYLVAAVLLTWPLAFHLDGFLLTSEFKDLAHSDEWLNVHTMTEARKLFYSSGVILYLNRDYGHYEYSILLHYLYIFSGSHLSPREAYNVYFLVSLFLSGVFMHLLAFELSRDRAASLLAGLMYMSSGYAMTEYLWSHPTTLAVQWIPLVFLLAEKSMRRAGLAYPALLGAALALQAYSGSQYTVYLSFMLPAYVLLRACLVEQRLPLRVGLLSLLAAFFVAGALSGYYVILRTGFPAETRSIAENMSPAWVLASPRELLDPSGALSVGLVLASLAVAAAAVIWRARGDESFRRYWPFGALSLLAVLGMMGPFSHYAPYWWLYRFWPAVSYYRVPLRLFPFALMGLSAMSTAVFVYAGRTESLRSLRAPLLALMAVLLALQTAASALFSAHHMFYG